MPNRRSEVTTREPSGAGFVLTTVAAVVASVTTLWIATGPEFDARHLAGYLLGLVASGALWGRTFGLAIRHGNARLERVIRQAEEDEVIPPRP